MSVLEVAVTMRNTDERLGAFNNQDNRLSIEYQKGHRDSPDSLNYTHQCSNLLSNVCPFCCFWEHTKMIDKRGRLNSVAIEKDVLDCELNIHFYFAPR